jgi:hypothetical protein
MFSLPAITTSRFKNFVNALTIFIILQSPPIILVQLASFLHKFYDIAKDTGDFSAAAMFPKPS